MVRAGAVQIEDQEVVKDDPRLPAEMGYGDYEIPENWRDYFGEIYDRDDQLEILISALQEAKESQFQNRFNVILFGPAGSGKSDICRTLKKMLPPDTWLEFDCTNTTMAGAIEELKNRATMPRVLFLEEAEKADSGSKKWLLAATDLRAEIRSVKIRRNFHKECHFLCVATVNDLGALQKEFTGALESALPVPDRVSPSQRGDDAEDPGAGHQETTGL